MTNKFLKIICGALLLVAPLYAHEELHSVSSHENFMVGTGMLALWAGANQAFIGKAVASKSLFAKIWPIVSVGVLGVGTALWTLRDTIKNYLMADKILPDGLPKVVKPAVSDARPDAKPAPLSTPIMLSVSKQGQVAPAPVPRASLSASLQQDAKRQQDSKRGQAALGAKSQTPEYPFPPVSAGSSPSLVQFAPPGFRQPVDSSTLDLASVVGSQTQAKEKESQEHAAMLGDVHDQGDFKRQTADREGQAVDHAEQDAPRPGCLTRVGNRLRRLCCSSRTWISAGKLVASCAFAELCMNQLLAQPEQPTYPSWYRSNAFFTGNHF